MRIAAAVFVCILAMLVSTVLGVWFLRDRPIEQEREKVKEAQKKEEGEDLVISKTPPWPKAVIDETEFNFGRTAVGQKGSHDFVIRNEGEAPLRLKKGKTTCQCTISSLSVGEIAPGESATINLSWEPTAQAEEFGKGAEIHTNDPENQSFFLKIDGSVVPIVLSYPDRMWPVDEIRETGPTQLFTKVVSPLNDAFTITKIESDDPLFVVEAEAITDAGVLEEHRALSGYWIKTTISPSIPVGAFTVPVRLHTDLTDPKNGDPFVVQVMVTGQRRGPFRILGQRWIENRSAITLGQFDAKEGRKATFTLIPRDPPPEGLQFTEIICEPKELVVKLETDDKAGAGMRRYTLVVEYPPDSPRAGFPDEHPGHIELHTNHPKAPVLKLDVILTAY